MPDEDYMTEMLRDYNLKRGLGWVGGGVTSMLSKVLNLECLWLDIQIDQSILQNCYYQITCEVWIAGLSSAFLSYTEE